MPSDDPVLPDGWTRAAWSGYLRRRAGLCDAAHKKEAEALRSLAIRHDQIIDREYRARGGFYAVSEPPPQVNDPDETDDSDRLEREAIMSVEAEAERADRCKR